MKSINSLACFTSFTAFPNHSWSTNLWQNFIFIFFAIIFYKNNDNQDPVKHRFSKLVLIVSQWGERKSSECSGCVSADCSVKTPVPERSSHWLISFPGCHHSKDKENTLSKANQRKYFWKVCQKIVLIAPWRSAKCTIKKWKEYDTCKYCLGKVINNNMCPNVEK